MVTMAAVTGDQVTSTRGRSKTTSGQCHRYDAVRAGAEPAKGPQPEEARHRGGAQTRR